MKRAVCIFFSLLFLTACSVQEKVNPQIFIERIQKNNKNIAVENSFYEDAAFVCFAVYNGNTDIVFEIETDEQKNAKKISLACSQTDKADDFISCAECIIKTYAPDDDSGQVIKELFSQKEINGKFNYYETQWYSYSSVLSENGLYFSAEIKKLVPQTEVEFSLKQNDIVTY